MDNKLISKCGNYESDRTLPIKDWKWTPIDKKVDNVIPEVNETILIDDIDAMDYHSMKEMATDLEMEFKGNISKVDLKELLVDRLVD